MAADPRALLGSTVSGTDATPISGPVSTVSARAAKSRSPASSARRRTSPCCATGSSGEPSKTTVTGSVAPLGKSRSSASSPCLATLLFGSDDVPAAPNCNPRTGKASANSTAVVAIRLIAGRRMTASTARRHSGPSSPAEAATRRPSHGTRKRSTRSPSTIRIAGWNVSATTIETSPTMTAPRPRLRKVVSGTSSIAIIASANAVPLNTTARVAVLATVRIASRVPAPRWRSSRRRATMNSE